MFEYQSETQKPFVALCRYGYKKTDDEEREQPHLPSVGDFMLFRCLVFTVPLEPGTLNLSLRVSKSGSQLWHEVLL